MAAGNINPMTSDFNYSKVFGFEESFDEESFLKWMLQNWTMAFWYSALYLILIFGGKYYMQSRPRFEIRPALALWSAILAIFSIFGAIRTVPETLYVLQRYGWEFSVCQPTYVQYGPTGFWTFMFAISKVYELGDTVFIVLRKQPLIFLHWYHHVTTLIYVWYSYPQHIGPGRWFIVMNYTIHSFMYTYYAFKALRFVIPKFVSMIITTLQILQMVVGTAVIISAYQVKSRGGMCQTSYENLQYSFLMYLSYVILFSYFFYNSYVNKMPPPKELQTKQQQQQQQNGIITNGFSETNGTYINKTNGAYVNNPKRIKTRSSKKSQ